MNNIVKGIGVAAVLLLIGQGCASQPAANNNMEAGHNDSAMQGESMMKSDDKMTEGDKMEKTGDSMMKDDAMMDNHSGDAMMASDKMEKDGTMMESGEKMMKDDTMEKEDNKMMESEKVSKGSYQEYSNDKLALANNGDAVIFFHASWCPTCRALDKDITKNLSTIPNGLTILKADYDSQIELRKKYGVTFQHTMVQVDASGNLINKWSGGNTLQSIVSRVK